MASIQTRTVGDFAVQNKILLITGGGSGIGLSFVKQFHSKGGRVLIGDLKLTADAETFLHATEASSRPGSVVFQHCDVTKWADLRALVSASVKQFGDVPDVYCPCAGVFEPPWSNFWADAEDDDYATLRINADHPIKLTRLAFRALVGAEKKGVVMLVSSAAGLRGTYGCALYVASKHAIVGLCRSLAHADGAEGIKVVCMCPGIVTTPLWEELEEERAKDFLYQEKELHHSPEEIAGAMMSLVEEGKYAGGTVYLKTRLREAVFNEDGPGDDLGAAYARSILDKERGKKWDIDL